MKDKICTKVVKVERVKMWCYDRANETYRAITSYVPYRGLSDSEIIYYFSDNILSENVQPISVMERHEDRLEWSYPFQDWLALMTESRREDLKSQLQAILDSLM